MADVVREGTFGRVTLIDGLAYKQIKAGDSFLRVDAVREVCALQALDHGHIVRLTAWQSHPAFIMTQSRHEDDLFHHILHLQSMGRVLSSTCRGRIRKQLISAVKYLHVENYMHRDIKSGNILVCENCKRVKLADFGTCIRNIPGRMNTMQVGTFNYSAPELLTTHTYDERVDWYSLGIVFEECRQIKCPLIKGACKEDYLTTTVKVALPDTNEARLIRHMIEPDARRRWRSGKKNAATTTTRLVNAAAWPPPLTSKMMTIVYDWMQEVVDAYHLHPHTLCHSKNLMNDYIHVRKDVSSKRLQLVAVAAILLVSRLYASEVPDDASFEFICAHAYSMQEIQDTAHVLLSFANGNLYRYLPVPDDG